MRCGFAGWFVRRFGTYHIYHFQPNESEEGVIWGNNFPSLLLLVDHIFSLQVDFNVWWIGVVKLFTILLRPT